MMTSFFARALDDPYIGPHSTVIVFAGPDPDHRANVGQLVMTHDEAAAFLALVNDDPMDLVAQTIREACTAGIRNGKACGICERIITVTREAL
jgi:hypothetical protein